MRAKTYDNEGHHFVTRNGTVVAYTRCWHWQKGFQADPSTKERMPTFLMQWRKYLVAAGVESTTPIGGGTAQSHTCSAYYGGDHRVCRRGHM